MRVRVLVDISQPLCRGRVISLDDDKELWVSFKYGRLPNICYQCECLTHNDRDCERWIDSEGTLEESNKKHGPWLEASSLLGACKLVVSVLNFYAKKGGAVPRQKKPGKTKWPMTNREPPVTTKPNLESIKHSISPSVLISEDTFHTGKHKVDPFQPNPSLVHSFNSKDPFEKHIEEIDRNLKKFGFPQKE